MTLPRPLPQVAWSTWNEMVCACKSPETRVAKRTSRVGMVRVIRVVFVFRSSGRQALDGMRCLAVRVCPLTKLFIGSSFPNLSLIAGAFSLTRSWKFFQDLRRSTTEGTDACPRPISDRIMREVQIRASHITDMLQLIATGFACAPWCGRGRSGTRWGIRIG